MAETARVPLDEDRIVDAALAVLREQGVAGLSMRALSTKLAVSEGATYRHVRSKADLLELCVRRLYADVDHPRLPGQDPLVWVRDLLLRVVDQMAQYPGVSAWVVQHGRLDAARVRLDESVRQALEAGGRTPEDARRSMRVLFFFVMGALLADYPTVLRAVGEADYERLLRQDLDALLGI